MAPLSLLDYRSAAHLWAALGVAALVASVLLLGGSDARVRPWLGWGLALSLLYTPVAEALVSGQKSTFLLLLFTMTYRLLARGTVEEKVEELQKRKRDLVRAVLGDEAGFGGKLSREDLELLMS